MRYAAVAYGDYDACGFENDVLSWHDSEDEAMLAVVQFIESDGPVHNAYVYDLHLLRRIDIDQNKHLRMVAFADFRADGSVGKRGIYDVIGKEEICNVVRHIYTKRGGFLRFHAVVPSEKPMDRELDDCAIRQLRRIAQSHFNQGPIVTSDGREFDQIRVWPHCGSEMRVDLSESGKSPMKFDDRTDRLDVSGNGVDRDKCEDVQRAVASALGVQDSSRIVVDL